MKTIGLIGGTSWESSIEYYRILNETVKERLGGLHSAKCIMHSVEFQEVVDLMQAGDWDSITGWFQRIAEALKSEGADFLVICSNTLNQTASDIEKKTGLPVLGIADAVAATIQMLGMKKVGFLGTKYAMEGDYYRNTLQDKYDIEQLIPEKEDREAIDAIIFQELCLGVIKQSSRDKVLGIISKLQTQGAEGIILGCTEIPLLIKQEDVGIPVFDTLAIHAVASVDMAME
ncbi:MAG TPA: aspartate/glutamate racemase family protein [Negativicutes bacterium]|nr:aspartate/glutamate racemase family protein [Negativicutes bacterium]